ncbi:DUF58 domain-containing protein [Herpetosiphon giganteus]|uniref:DUF58 domain-containing protein n=1 Tax=Herpetosiphon giganteus TaxID=2029754 RepID=UPI001957E159|nr:DUF58 domain-containing protein [Herpetosiphon giganteus]MBM7846010.1 uncharacterized protein (DUF58 family) [Herpetosiphon giganteus]
MRALGILSLAVVLFLTGLSSNIPFFYYLTYTLLGLLVIAYAWAWSNLEGLEIERESSTTRAQVGETVRERITIYNTWPLPKLWVEVRDHSDLPSHGSGFVSYIPGREKRRWMVRTPCTLRGKWRLGPVSVRSGDPFGIFQLHKMVDLTHDLLVYPATVDLPKFELPTAELIGGQDVRSRTFHVTPNVSTVRQYVPGDSFNRIHWRSTARTGALMVKEFELDPSADVWIILDMEERFHHGQPDAAIPAIIKSLQGKIAIPNTTEEYSITLAASLARHLLRLNRSVGLLTYGAQREIILPEREARQLYKILEPLAMLHATSNTSLAELLAAESQRFGRNSSLLIITAALDERWVAAVQRLVYRGARASIMFLDGKSFGGWRDPEPTFARLAELRVPVYRIHAGDGLDSALAEPAIRAMGRS